MDYELDPRPPAGIPPIDFRAQLNDEQFAAVTAQPGPLLVLAGAGFSDIPGFPLPWLLPAAMWVLAALSLLTVAQRLHSVRCSPGAIDPLRPDVPEGQ